MAYDAEKRLKLYGIAEGLWTAVRRADRAAAQEFRNRLAFAIEYAPEGDPSKPLNDALHELLKASGEWCRSVVDENDAETRKQLMQLIDGVTDFLIQARRST